MSLIALSLYQALQIRQKEKKIELNVRAPALKCDMHIIIAIRLMYISQTFLQVPAA